MLIASFISSCYGPEEKKLRQFKSYGRLIFQEQCANCHQDNGDGYQELYPSLKKSNNYDKISDYSCLIKNGSKDINVGMPAFANLKDDEIAKVLTYIYNSFGNKAGIIEVEDVKESLNRCDN